VRIKIDIQSTLSASSRHTNVNLLYTVTLQTDTEVESTTFCHSCSDYTLNVYSADTRHLLVFGVATNSEHASEILKTHQAWVARPPYTKLL